MHPAQLLCTAPTPEIHCFCIRTADGTLQLSPSRGLIAEADQMQRTIRFVLRCPFGRSKTEYYTQLMNSKIEYYAQSMNSKTEYCTQSMNSKTEYYAQSMNSKTEYYAQSVNRTTEYYTQSMISKTEYCTQSMNWLKRLKKDLKQRLHLTSLRIQSPQLGQNGVNCTSLVTSTRASAASRCSSLVRPRRRHTQAQSCCPIGHSL